MNEMTDNNFNTQPGQNMPPEQNLPFGQIDQAQIKAQAKFDLRKCANRNSALLILFYALVLPLSFLAAEIIRSSGADLTNPDIQTFYKLIVYSAQYLLVVPIILILGNRKQPHKVRTYFNPPQESPKKTAKWILMTIGVTYMTSYIFNIIFAILQAILRIEFTAPDMSGGATAFDGLVTVFAYVFLAPLFEEMMFRGTLLTHTHKFGQWFSAIVIGCTFGLFHANYQQIFYAAVMGICACFLALKTKSIIPPLCLHLTFNTIGAVQALLLGQLDMDKLLKYDLSYIMEKLPIVAVMLLISFICFAAAITGTIFLILELKNHKETFHLENGCPQLTKGEKAKIYLTAPVTIIFIIGIIGFTVYNMFPNAVIDLFKTLVSLFK